LEQGVVFAVRRVEIDYLAAAMLGDEVKVTVAPEEVRRVRFVLSQDVWRLSTDNEPAKMASARVTLACLTTSGKICPVPERLAQEMSRLNKEESDA
jgi:acyl-CoA thioester hydrolase